MATAFTRTLRSLEGESSRSTAWTVAAALALLAGWTLWVATAHISIYETTSAARLEVDHAASTIQASTAGRVIDAQLVIGKEVAAGDVLVQLDASGLALQ